MLIWGFVGIHSWRIYTTCCSICWKQKNCSYNGYEKDADKACHTWFYLKSLLYAQVLQFPQTKLQEDILILYDFNQCSMNDLVDNQMIEWWILFAWRAIYILQALVICKARRSQVDFLAFDGNLDLIFATFNYNIS